MTYRSVRFIEHKPLLYYWIGACCVLNGSVWNDSTEAGIPSFPPPKHDLESEYAILNYPNVINLGDTKIERRKIILRFAGSREL